MGRLVTFAAGAVLLAATWRYASFTLALAAALTLSPIVWLDYFALAAVPLRHRQASPVARLVHSARDMGACQAGIDTGDAPETIRLLVVFAIVFAVAFRNSERPESRRDPVPVAA